MGNRSHWAAASALLSLLLACDETRTSTPVAPEAPRGFAIHEWGLIGIDTQDRGQASTATSVASGPTTGPSHSFGTIGSGGKPVIYVHLDPGVDEVRFDLRIRVPAAHLVERWPTGGALDPRVAETEAGFRNVVARRGSCAAETPAPTAGSPACAAPSDRFCEAAEIPRYAGDRASCLTVDDTTSEVLFYRTDALRAPQLSLRLLSSDDEVQVSRLRGDAIEGPIFLVRTPRLGGPVYIERLAAGDFGAPRPLPRESLTPNDVRIALTDEAVKRGLTPREAEAFVDAWAPAYFDVCRRAGPEASGEVPTVLAQAGTSLLYFAPAAAVEAMLPLSTSPPARETRRVFLVRWVDGSTVFRAEPGLGTIGHGGGSGSAYTPCSADPCPSLRFEGEPVVTGGLAPDVVRRVLRRSSNVLRYCYERGLARAPELRGTVTLDFVIGANGLVSSAVVARSTLHDEAAERCMASAIGRMTFPAPEPRGNVRVRQVLELSLAPRDH